MKRTLLSVAFVLGVLSLTFGVGIAATPSSGTLSPVTPTLNFTGGPFTGANPTGTAGGLPNCSIPNTCDTYTLTINIPAGYSVLHPNDFISVKVQWPDPGTNDFDVYILDSATDTQVQAPAASSSDPEITAWPVVDGSVTYRVRIVAYQAANESYNATITLGPVSTNSARLGSYAAGTELWSCNTHLDADNPTGPPPTFDHNHDAEPLVSFDGNGKFYIGAIAGVPAGSGLWATADACGQSYEFIGAPDQGVGGGDVDVMTAPVKNVLGNYNVYQSSLWLGNMTTAFSSDGGHTFALTPISSISAADDRQWNAAYDTRFCWISYRQGAVHPSDLLEVTRMDFGPTGLGPPVIGPPTSPWATLSQTPSRGLGNMFCDRRPGANTTLLMAAANGAGNLYHAWVEENRAVWMSVSKDFGTTWNSYLVWDGGEGASYDHFFPFGSVDTAGNVYLVFSDDRNSYLSTSTDQGQTWSRPVRVNRGGASNLSIFPNLAVGAPGRVVIGFYGSTAPSVTDNTAVWRTFVSRCNDALATGDAAINPASAPHFEEVQVSNQNFYTGPVCEQGLACSSGRDLLECFDIDVDPVDGSAALAYASQGVGTYITRQLNGASLFGGTIVDRSVACPALNTPCNVVEGCIPGTGDPCIAPGVIVSCDALNDQSPLGMAGDDIEKVSVAEPQLGKLAFTMKMASLDPNNLPPSRVWYIVFTPSNGSTVYFVDMSDCDPTQGPMVFEYGTLDPTLGFQTAGMADAGVVHPDGSIEITISKSLVGNPPNGSMLNAVHGDVRLFAGAACNGLVSQLDSSPNGSFAVGSCAPVPALVQSFIAGEADGGVDLDWTSIAVDLIDSWNLYRSATPTGGFVRVNDQPIPMDEGGSFHFHDSAAATGTVYYQLAGVMRTGGERIVDTQSLTVSGAPTAFSFQVAGANPFRDRASLDYTLTKRTAVTIAVYNAAGAKVRTLVNQVQDAGSHIASFDRRDDRSRMLSPGVYMVRITAGENVKSLRLIAVN